MTPRERVLATLQRKPVDRVPVDVWLTPEVLDSLKEHTGLTAELEVYRKLGIDKIAWLPPCYPAAAVDPNQDSAGLDPWGIPRHKVTSGLATYFEFGEPPLGDMEDPAELEDYSLWPDLSQLELPTVKNAAVEARSLDFATIGPWVSHYEIYCHMRGMENALMDLVADPDFATAALDKIEAIQSDLLHRYLTELGDLVDMVFISDDMGTQQSLLISLDAWKTHFRPRLKRWCDLVHSYGKTVFYHSDGAIRELVPHLIDCGVDVLNPIQHICTGMDRAVLKRDFGSRLIFHGGVENQHILPFGSVDDVRKEVRTCLETLGHGGGYIPSSCHNIQAGTPVANVLAMVDAVHQWA